jgi:D-glycero-beta-D-manno-heptose-7-phosphate kinase
MSDTQRLRRIIESWRGRRVLVLGDLVADEHVVGRPLAIAREAPVLVLEHLQRQVRPGGAANPAANAQALGAQVLVCGIVGDDGAGEALRDALAACGADTTGILVDPSRPTTTKTRIWAGGAQQHVQQLMLRLDRVERRPVDDGLTRRLAEYVAGALDGADALMLSDYENGVIHPALIEASLAPALARGKVVTVDAHGDLFRFRGATLFTPNQPEAEATLGRAFAGSADLEAAGVELRERLGARAVLVTRGREGMSLFEAGESAVHVPALATNAVDPTGAGDTVAAAFTLAACAGASLRDAAHLANVAASIVVARVGTAVATAADLLRAIGQEPR